MEEKRFKELIQRIVEQYALAPEVAMELLQRILTKIKNTGNDLLQNSSNYEILTEYIESEEMP